MRHRKKSEKFCRSYAQRRALVKALLRSFVTYERIITTESKAKALRGWVDKLITWAKENTLTSRRRSYRLLQDHKLVKKLFEKIGPRFKDIGGGYTRIIKLGYRKGDGAKKSLLELTKIEKIEKKPRVKKEREKEQVEEKKEERPVLKKEMPTKKFLGGIRRIFKRERDAL